MNLAIQKPNLSPLDQLCQVIEQMIERFKTQKQSIHDNISYCRQIRTARKHFEKNLKSNISKFEKQTEVKQMEIELHFYNVLKDLEIKIPEILEELEDENWFMSFFLRREVRKSYRLVVYTQREMSQKVYPNNADKIINDPEKYQKLVDSWGDLADDEY
ncbi:hypothetical protein [Mucilaginibacter sp. NFR10]|uniref:hypothetical protein n=1 Tax=Mucilaginibacter sp. NFR10 TaxID=1566292 RepID=UPI001113F2FF|nr:hypothetical protein [Mucilaginibacter sp. NFR10]